MYGVVICPQDSPCCSALTDTYIDAPANFPTSHRRPQVGDTVAIESRTSDTALFQVGSYFSGPGRVLGLDKSLVYTDCAGRWGLLRAGLLLLRETSSGRIAVGLAVRVRYSCWRLSSLPASPFTFTIDDVL